MGYSMTPISNPTDLCQRKDHPKQGDSGKKVNSHNDEKCLIPIRLFFEDGHSLWLQGILSLLKRGVHRRASSNLES